jgi:hypothetical protein
MLSPGFPGPATLADRDQVVKAFRFGSAFQLLETRWFSRNPLVRRTVGGGMYSWAMRRQAIFQMM